MHFGPRVSVHTLKNKSETGDPLSHWCNTRIFPSATAFKCSPYGLFPYSVADSASFSLLMRLLIYAISSGAEITIPCLVWIVSTKFAA